MAEISLLNVRIQSATSMPEFIDPVITKTSPKRSFSVIENAHFWLVSAKTGSINLGTGLGSRD
jgi:hypothetical protein